MTQSNAHNDYDGIYKDLMHVPIPEIPRSLKVRSVLKELKSFSEAFHLTDKEVAAHACFWAPCDEKNKFGHYPAKVMMHLRFDGTLGFPGGLIDAEDADLLEGLTRELKEEIDYSEIQQRKITTQDYHSTRVQGNLILHFFVVKLTLEQFKELEKRALNAREYGREVLGTMQVPLYTMDNSYSGLPAFINNKFIGNAKQGLIMALFSAGVLDDDKVDTLIHNANNMKLAPNKM